MAQIHEFTAFTGNLADGHFFLMDTGSNTYSVTYEQLVDAILNKYNELELGGSERTVKAAIDSLNTSRVADETNITDLQTIVKAAQTTTATDFNSITTNGVYWINLSGKSNAPKSTGYGYLSVTGGSAVKIQDFTLWNNGTSNMGGLMMWRRIYTNGQWYGWMQNGASLSGTVTGTVAANDSVSVSVDLTSNPQPNSSYIIAGESLTGYISFGVQQKSTTGFKMFISNHSSSSANAQIRWTLVNAPASSISTTIPTE